MNKSAVLYEISWEVCNKVGGIHTVINSKFKNAKKTFENYYLVGPYLEGRNQEFVETQVPEEFVGSYDYLKSIGITLHFGYSNLLENSNVILVEYLDYAHNINDIKTRLWEKYSIDSINSSWYDFDEAILWSWCSGIAIESLEYSQNRSVIVHSHEWMAGGAIFAVDTLRDEENSKFKTIFTTHATMLGRSIGGNGENLYDIIDKIDDPESKAYELGVNIKFQCEKALANFSDSFTTVSDNTALEAEKFFGKKVDAVFMNGFDNSNSDGIDGVLVNFIKSRTKINNFLGNHFEGIDFDKYKVFYTSGRNEVRNKGVDVYIKSLAKLNEKLKEENSEVKVVNFILLMTGEFDLIEGNSLLTHDCQDHEILKLLKENNLNNNPEDKVFNVFVPVMLNGDDGAINQEYYDFVSGCDLGVFPSLYEPWGYTPLESISYGVPTITSDASGFGQSIYLTCGNSCSSVSVLPRERKNEDIVVETLTKMLNSELKLNQRSSLFQKEVSKLLAFKYDWNELYKSYINEYVRLL